MTPEVLQQIATAISRAGASDANGRELRRAFDGTHFTFCADDDVIRGKPVWSGAGFNLYLVDGNDHCMQITQELARATGVLVATVE